MANDAPRWTTTLKGSLVIRLALYYAAISLTMLFAWRYIPHSEALARQSMDALFGLDAVIERRGARALAVLDQTTLAITVALAMSSAAALSLPVAWVYIRTRAKRGYAQSVVQTLIVLPVVVAGVVVLVKYSIALAFSLAGIVAAVRFRNTLDDSKDAVYIFLATGIGLAAAVDLPVALVISVIFNTVVLVLWYADFGRSPAHLDGTIGERRLQRAMEQLSRTGTFVARIDEHVFKEMTPEQLAAVADRAWRRARRNAPRGAATDGKRETLLRVRTGDIERLRDRLEPQLGGLFKSWRYGGVVHEDDGSHVVEYTVTLRKGETPDALLEQVRDGGAPHLMHAELS